VALINLNTLDPPILEQTNFGPDMRRWISNIVDIINASFTNLQNAMQNLIGVGGQNIGGMGAGPISVTVTGLLPSGFVSANLVSSTNPVYISNVTSGTNSFSINFSGDPGASCIITYLAFSQQPK
jgi:hypothetical protein